ncbi:MAG: hypothetical protein ACE5GA_05025, partial [Candidatus Zixiibacteriota bacterium]
MKADWTLFERHAAATRLLSVSLVAVLLMALPQAYQALSEGAIFVFKKPFVHIQLAVSDLYHAREKARRLEEALMQSLVRINMLEQEKEENVRLRAQS